MTWTGYLSSLALALPSPQLLFCFACAACCLLAHLTQASSKSSESGNSRLMFAFRLSHVGGPLTHHHAERLAFAQLSVRTNHLVESMEMLVVSRKLNERIVIGEGDETIALVVIDIKGDRVRLGIDAPPSVSVHRQEVYDLIMSKKETTQ